MTLFFFYVTFNINTYMLSERVAMMKGKKILIIFLLLFTVFGTYCLWADKAISEREFQIKSERIPSDFDGYRIVHISDLHNALFGEGNKKLVEKIRLNEPDIIVITGDIVDSRHTDTAIALDFIKRVVEIAPVYYVSGNHEFRIPRGIELIENIKSLGATVLENESMKLIKGNSKITLCGIDDPYFYGGYMTDKEFYVTARTLEAIEKTDNFMLLLSHRPEFFDLYCEYGFDLVLSGHAHGGQFRLPFIGGLIAPGQGLFPEYDSGLYEKNGTSMIVSRGLGNSIIPLRLFNRPEIITVVLNSN